MGAHLTRPSAAIPSLPPPSPIAPPIPRTPAVMYFGWAYLPETFAAVVTADAPNRYWAIAVPMHLCVTTAVIFLCFLGHSLR